MWQKLDTYLQAKKKFVVASREVTVVLEFCSNSFLAYTEVVFPFSIAYVQGQVYVTLILCATCRVCYHTVHMCCA